MVEQFAADGYDAVLVARDEERLAAVADRVADAHGVATHVISADLAQAGAATALYERVRAAGHEVDALVNNAGFGTHEQFVDGSLETDLAVLQLHVVTVTGLTRLFGTTMVERGSGAILNVASTLGYLPMPTSAVYSAAKHYERAFTEILAHEFADTGVTVTALCPGPTDTQFMDDHGMEEAAYDESRLMAPEVVARAGYEGMQAGERVVVPGLRNRLEVFSRRLVPRETMLSVLENAQTGE